MLQFPVLLLTQILAGPGYGDVVKVRTPATRAADSLAILRDARRAQSDFEIRRRRLLPVTYGSGGRCDVQLGRFCYWHDDEESDPPDEPPSIGKLRGSLLGQLGEWARDLPGDRWIAGQRVRYLIESDSVARAVEAAQACEAEPAWCSALAGLAYHAARRFEASDSAFDAALTRMPDADRCRWEDIEELLPPRAAEAYSRLDCATRRILGNRAWFLADPAWTSPGNDRRTEHYSRHVMSELERRSRSTYESTWGEDTHRLIVRYGWPTRWSRAPEAMSRPWSVHVIGHEPHPSFQFFPDDSVLAAPQMLSTEAWDLKPREARSRYAPAYARRVRAVDAQIARLPRGDSMQLIVAYDVARDTALFSVDAVAQSVVLDSSGVVYLRQELRNRSGRGVARMTLPGEPAFIGIELTDSTRESLGIARESVSPPERNADGARLSDPIVFFQPAAGDGTLDAILDRVAGSDAIPQGHSIGLYWDLERREARADSVTWTVTVVPRDAGLLRRVARLLRLRPGASPVHVSFTEPIGAAERTHRVITLDVRVLPRGTYELTLSAATSRGGGSSASRRLRVGR
jgi:hypothetical protein